MTNKNEEHKKARDFAIECMDAGRKVSIKLDANNNLYAVAFGELAKHFHFDPPKPEFEAGIFGYGYRSNERTGHLIKLVGFDPDTEQYLGTDRKNGNIASAKKFDNFTPLEIYSELEKYKRALEASCRLYCFDNNCGKCILPKPSDTNPCGIPKLITHFLNEATRSIESEVGDGECN
jgi:hypothetical protein